jgi:hypothetical protein
VWQGELWTNAGGHERQMTAPLARDQNLIYMTSHLVERRKGPLRQDFWNTAVSEEVHANCMQSSWQGWWSWTPSVGWEAMLCALAQRCEHSSCEASAVLG